MNIISRLKEWFALKFATQAEKEFNVKAVTSSEMGAFINTCADIYRGRPAWRNGADDIETINFAKSLCSETARLATLGISVTLAGSARADWLQSQINNVFSQIRHWVEYGCALGTIVLKPDVSGVDVYTPDEFMITNHKNGSVTEIVFLDQKHSADGKRVYTRLEKHTVNDDGTYTITNRCYVGNSTSDISRPINIAFTPWKELEEEVTINNLKRPLYSVFRMPQANHIDINSPLGLPIFSEAIQELRDLDIAYSRNAKEIFDSKRTILVDSDVLLPLGKPTSFTAQSAALSRQAMGLPDMVTNVNGNGIESYYQEINPTLNTAVRITGINALLNQIGYKSGFSNGYFVFNENTGLATATQVEADQQRTIQLVADIREKLSEAIKGLVYALNAFADLYDLAPLGTYDESSMLHFEDITYSFEEDKQHHYSLAMQGKYPWEEYYVQFLKCSREEARALLAMVKKEQAVPTLFGMDE